MVSEGVPTRGRLSDLGGAAGVALRAAAGAVALYVCLTVLGAVLPIVMASVTRVIFDSLATARPAEANIVRAAALLGATGLLSVVVPQLARYVKEGLDHQIALRSSDELYEAVGRIEGLGKFETPEFIDQLRLATQSGASAPGRVLTGLVNGLGSLCTIVGFAGALWVVNPVVTAFILLATVPAVLGEFSLARRRTTALWQTGPIERLEIVYSSLLSGLDAAKEVRLLGLSDFLRARMLQERRAAIAIKRRLDRLELLLQTGLGSVSAVVSGLGLLWAAHAAARGSISIGDVSMLVAGIAGVHSSLQEIVNEAANVQHELLLFHVYREVVDSEADLPRPATTAAVPAMRVGLEFRDVWFRYAPDHPWVLREVNLHIPSGELVAIVGKNGAGKSTLAKLICRFYDPTRGSIRWDGIDLRHMDPSELRGRIAAVFQDLVGFEMTAAENIAVGDVSRLEDSAAIAAAAEEAGVHSALAALPHGYGTLLTRAFLGEPNDTDSAVGVTLSGGQWQKVALARAFLRRPRDLLILDEPSASLDPVAERELRRSLCSRSMAGTRVLISHRLSTIRDADRVFVLEGGRIVEEGSHDELSAIRGVYAGMFLN